MIRSLSSILGSLRASLFPRLRALADNEHGAVAIIGVVTLPVLLGLLGLGGEASYWFVKQRKLQHSADFAAFAGALQCRTNKPDRIFAAAKEIVDKSNDSGGLLINPIIKAYPTVPCTQTGKRYVTVELEINVDRYVSKLFLSGQQKIIAKASAVVDFFESTSSACVLALAPAASDAIKITSAAASLNAIGCDVVSNSNATDSVHANTISALCVYTAGLGNIANTQNISCDKKLVENSYALPDPYAGRVLPSMNDPACIFDKSTIPAPGTAKVTGNATILTGDLTGGTVSIGPKPGCSYVIFDTDIEFAGGWTFLPGTYIFKGSYGVNTANDAAKRGRFYGDNVTFVFNTPEINSSINNYYNLKAPTTGPMAGILFYQNNPTGTIQNVTFGAQGNSNLTGALYFPTANLQLKGGAEAYVSGAGRCTQIIGYTIDIAGNSNFEANEQACRDAGVNVIRTDEFIAILDE